MRNCSRTLTEYDSVWIQGLVDTERVGAVLKKYARKTAQGCLPGIIPMNADDYFSTEKSNDVSRNLVVNLPDRKVGLSISAR